MDDDVAGRIDPPQEPFPETTVWFASSPAPLLEDERLAVLMVRVGMAANALGVQVRGVRIAESLRGSARMQHILCSLVTSAAITYEAMGLAQEGMRDLRELARTAGAPDRLLNEIGKLCGGRHPARQVLDRARNRLGFHWDENTIAASVREYGRNDSLIWIEIDPEGIPVYRLAIDVLAHALIKPGDGTNDSQESEREATAVLKIVGEAMNTIIEFFIAAGYGYMRVVGAGRHIRGTENG